MPAAACRVLVAAFNPGRQAVPGSIGLRRGKVGQDQLGVGKACIPPRQQGAGQLALLDHKIGHAALLRHPALRHDAAERSKRSRSDRTIRALALDAERRVPAKRRDGRKQPLAYKPRSAVTITVQSDGTTPANWPNSASQCGRQAPARVASTTRQAMGMAQPCTGTVMLRMVKRCPKVEASIASARWWQWGGYSVSTHRNNGAKQSCTTRLRRLSPRLAPRLWAASRYQSRSCSRVAASDRSSSAA